LIAEDRKILARLLHQFGQSHNAAATACLIGGTAGEQQRWHVSGGNLLKSQFICPRPAFGAGL
jgi:hypothetical protein